MSAVKCIASGGKGGVGKSTITILTARASAALGIRVGVVDLALGNPTTSLILLGEVPRHTLATYVINASRLGEVVHVVPTEHGPIYLVPSGRGDLALVSSYGGLVEGFGEIINYLIDRVGVDYVLVDFPAFEPEVDEVFGSALRICDTVYPIGTQDPGSLIAVKNLAQFARRNSLELGRPLLNMFRESLGRQWVSALGKLVGVEPSVVHYDPWLIRWVNDGGGHYGIGVKEALTYILKDILK
ncbi:MAG: hypothetical protein AT717_02170 [Vulcanisaeta sp. CIS_19]|nr:MAG: hypothetical protein AT717_02170 [Vulcanisaeta sp. CIS_19]